MSSSEPVAKAPNDVILGGFRLVEQIGVGGMGEVWRAENAKVSRMARAVKVIRPELAAIPEFRERFLREAEYLDLLQHPNILRVENIGEEQGLLFMVMELLSGVGADQLVGHLSVEQACRLVRDAAQGVAQAHSHKIFHRDLKPSNLFLTDAGDVRVLDFGIARHGDGASRLTSTGVQQPGSPAYYAPELVMGKPSSGASDVYALGVTLFELIAGRLPFEPEPGVTDTQAVLFFMHHHSSMLFPDIRTFKPDVSADLQKVIAHATMKDPVARIPNAAALVEVLSPFASGTLPTRRGTTPVRLGPSAKFASDVGRTPTGSRSTGAESGSLATRFHVSSAAASPRATPSAGPHFLSTRFQLPGSTEAAAEGPGSPAISGKPKSRAPFALLGAAAVAVAIGGVYVATRKHTPAPAPGPVTQPATIAKPEAPTRPAPLTAQVPEGMVAFVGGTFHQGRASYGDRSALDVPAHAVTVGPFALGKAEVTVDEYRQFVAEKHVKAPWPEVIKDFSVIGKLPAVDVSEADAAAYCAWKYPGGRLPTESEWEFAARAPDGRLYPWGNDFRPECVNSTSDAISRLEPPGEHSCGASPAGLVELSGNAWEWTSSPPAAYPGSAAKVPPAGAGFFIIRGGSFSNASPDQLTMTTRAFIAGPNRFTGFRCAHGMGQ